MSFEIQKIETASPELAEAVARLTPQLNPNHPALSQHDLAVLLTQPHVALLIARLGSGEIVGMLWLGVYQTLSGTHAWIEDVVVDQAARGQGIGEALTRAGIDEAVRRGAGSLQLTSRPARESANRLYQRMGFQLKITNLYFLDLSGLTP